MIESSCPCGQPFEATESACSSTIHCSACQAPLHLICTEQLPEGAGAGDFDAMLIVERGPHGDRVGTAYYLGGVQPITLGKLSTSAILLPGSNVSRHHATMERVDFGPSRWRIVDHQSTNGLWVNGDRVTEGHELAEGEVLTIGDYDLKFQMAAVPAPAEVAATAAPAASAQPAVPPSLTRAPIGTPRGIAYARPGARRAGDDIRPLGESDPAWVMTLRNASHLLVLGVCCNILGTCTGGVNSPVGMLFGVGGALLSFFGAWMLSKGEPGAPAVVTAILLRVAAAINVAGNLLTLLGAQAKQPPLIAVGAMLGLASVPQLFLLLWTLRRLAIRLPSPGLAANAVIVMIGLPAAMLAFLGGIVAAVVMHSAGLAILGGVSGLALLVFAIWYIVLLVWFNKSFS